VNFSQIYFDPQNFSGINERVYGSKAAIELARGQWGEVERKGELQTLEVPPAPERADYYAMEAFVNAARNKQKPLNNIQSANLSTRVAILGRMAIEQKRIVKWSEVS
jgi:predicted dehydrogenase